MASVLTADRNTPRRDGQQFSYPVAASTTIYAGSLVVLDSSGNAEPATLATGKIAVGMAEAYVANSGSAGDKFVTVRSGIFGWAKSGSVTKASIGDIVYAHDDTSVQTSSTSASAAGVLVDVDGAIAYVQTAAPVATVTTGLLVANNLSDVGTVATARASLGLDTGDSPTFTGLTLSGGATVATTLDVAGRVTGLRKHIAGGAAYTVSSAVDGFGWITTATDASVITLPDAAAGNDGKQITITCTAANGAALVSISPHSSDGIFGGVNGGSGGSLVSFSGTVNKDAQLTKATQLKGDYITVVSDGTTGWYVIGGQGVWASEA